MAKKNTRSSATKNLATSYFSIKRTRRNVVPLPSKHRTVKIEGVRMLRSKWVAEIKHPHKKNVRIWLGSYATQEQASRVYQLKKMEHEEMKLRDTAKKGKALVDDQEVGSAHLVSDAESLSDDRDGAMKGLDVADQGVKDVDFDDQVMKDVDFDDRDVGFDDQGMKIFDFTSEKTGRLAVPLTSKQQVPINIEGVRMKKSKWVAEIKHPKKKNVRIWLGSYATQEEASKVYQLKKMEHEKLKLQAIAEKDKLVDDQEVVSAHAESNAQSVSDDPDVMLKVVNSNDQVMKVIDFDDKKIVNVLKESNAESQSDDRGVTMNVVGSDGQATKIVHFDDQAERSLSVRRVVEQEAGDMLLQLGPILIDMNGYLLGEFSWMDNLSIV